MSLLGMFGGDDRHPMHSAEAARELIALIPMAEPLRALGDITQWLRSVGEAPDFKTRTRLEVTGLLDDAGRAPRREMVRRYLKDPRLRNARGRLAWSAAYEFWSALAVGYQRCALEEIPQFVVGEAGREPLAGLASRALRARVGQIRMAMLHYEPVPPRAWQGLYALHARCERAGLVSAPTFAYPAEQLRTSPLQELMKGLLVAIAAPERLPPEEVEAAFRIAQRFAGAGRLEAEPFVGATHRIELDGGAPPSPLAPGAAASPFSRFLGAQKAVPKLEHMIGHHELAMLDEDERLAREVSPGQKITVLRQFMNYWGAHPPQVERKLIRLEGGMSVAHGFHAVCHYVPHVVTRHADDKEKAKSRSASLEVAEEEDIEPPETWPERDAGLNVVHARAETGAGAWAEVGDLAAIRIHDRSDWWLAAIRRLAPGEGGALEAEFEVLARKPFSVWLRVLGQKDRMASNWETTGSFAYDYVQAVVLTDRAAPGRPPPLVVPKGKFVPGQILELLYGERSRFLRFTEFLEQGKDFDWCAIEWQATAH